MLTKMCVLVCVIAAPCKLEITDDFLDALACVESGGNPKAVGDNGRAIGLMQVWDIYWREANRIIRYPVFCADDRWDPEAAREMARIVLGYWGRWHQRKGRKIGYAELCSLHRHPCAAWRPKNMNSKLEKGRTKKLLTHLKTR